MSRTPIEPLVVKADDAARLLGVCRAQVYRLIEMGELRRVRLGNTRSIRIPMDDIRRLAGQEVPSDAA